MSSEAALQTKLVKALRARPGVTVVNIVGGIYGENGESDLIINWYGKFVAVELKKPGRFGTGRIVWPEDFKPTDRREEVQKRFALKVNQDGAIAFFSDDYKATLDYLDSIML